MQTIDVKRKGVGVVYKKAKSSFASEMGKIIVEMYEGLIAIFFPSPKADTKQFWVLCPRCKRYHPLLFNS